MKPAVDPSTLARYTGGVGHPDRKSDERSKLTFLGLSQPQIHSLSKLLLSWSTDPAQDLTLWCQVFSRSRVFEIKGASLKAIKRLDRKFVQNDAARILKLVDWVDNWVHSDELSQLYAHLLEQNPRLKRQYEAWARSKNPWLRRQSLVGILNYSRERKRVPPAAWILGQVSTHLHDPHFYVQKGLGWCLRELDRIHPKMQRRFVEKNVALIPPAAWYATTELYSAALKKRLLKKRSSIKKRRRSTGR